MDLTGKILIAMPGMGDVRFERSVILLCAYSSEGAMGLIINKPAPDLSFSSLLSHMNIETPAARSDIRVHFGGPVERGRGFVLHSSDWPDDKATMHVPGGFGMTATVDILHAFAGGSGPAVALLALGYSGWGAGQLDQEIARNDWLTAEPSSDLVFSDNDSGKWAKALRSLGIDALTLSSSAGRA